MQVRGLKQYEKIEVPRPAEVGDYDRVHGHRGEEFFPGRVDDCRRRRHFGRSQRRFYVVQLFGRYGGMKTGLLEAQPQPEHVPYQPHHAWKHVEPELFSTHVKIQCVIKGGLV